MALLDPYTIPLDAKSAEHLLRRTMFGATRKDINQLVGKTAEAAVAMLLADQPTPPPPVLPTDGSSWVTAGYDNLTEGTRYASLRGWWVGLMITQPISIVEKMTLFWHNHFVSTRSTVGDARYMYKQNALLRKYALGNIKTFVREITVDPAMLRYLNGNTNRVGSAQENYARELQELFTIGKGPEIEPGNYTNYTEDDVRAAARVLTGWSDVNASVTSTFNANRHDKTDKKFSSAYGNVTIKGRTGADAGMTELNDLLEMIFKQPETAKNLCRDVYRWFVNHEITADVEKNVIEPLATLLRNGGYEIKPVMAKLLASRHFFDANMRGCMIKTPIDLVMGTIRQFQLPVPSIQLQRIQYYNVMEQFRNAAGQLQMDLMELPNVAGWPAYYQEPAFYQIWINTATLPNRVNFANNVLNGLRVVVGNVTQTFFQLDMVEYIKNFADPGNPNKMMDELTENFFAVDLSQKQKDFLLTDVLMPNVPVYEWTEIWNNYLKEPTSPSKKNAAKTRLDTLLRYLMGMAEFQVM